MLLLKTFAADEVKVLTTSTLKRLTAPDRNALSSSPKTKRRAT